MKTEQSEEDFECDYDDQIEAYQQKGCNEAVEKVLNIIKSVDKNKNNE